MMKKRRLLVGQVGLLHTPYINLVVPMEVRQVLLLLANTFRVPVGEIQMLGSSSSTLHYPESSNHVNFIFIFIFA